jgi:hypothetical protein
MRPGAHQHFDRHRQRITRIGENAKSSGRCRSSLATSA